MLPTPHPPPPHTHRDVVRPAGLVALVEELNGGAVVAQAHEHPPELKAHVLGGHEREVARVDAVHVAAQVAAQVLVDLREGGLVHEGLLKLVEDLQREGGERGGGMGAG